MRKKNLKRAMFWLGVGIIIILLLDSIPSAEYTSTDVHYVKPGDTLWDIAGEYAGNHVSYDRYIYEMKRLNSGLTEKIRPGQKLVVPVYERGEK